MSAQIIDGKALAQRLREALRPRIEQVIKARKAPPGLGVILVGDDPASAVYVRNKEKAALAIGMHSEVVRLPASASQAEVLAKILALNADPRIDGFLLQLPVPKGLDADALSTRIAADKDADGLHPDNLGKLVAGLPAPRPCTPSGVMQLLREAKVDPAGKHAVVIGRSTIVGKPQALLLLAANATVTVCHSKTENLADHVRRADIVVAAVGKAGLVKGDWLKAGSVVIDVGTNRVGDKLVGDVDFEAAKERAAAITPVPGGVGPMTIAMLLENAVAAAERRVA